MEVPKDVLVKLFKATGFGKADEWPDDKLRKNANEVPKMEDFADDVSKVGDKELKNLGVALIAAVKKGNEVRVGLASPVGKIGDTDDGEEVLPVATKTKKATAKKSVAAVQSNDPFGEDYETEAPSPKKKGTATAKPPVKKPAAPGKGSAKATAPKAGTTAATSNGKKKVAAVPSKNGAPHKAKPKSTEKVGICEAVLAMLTAASKDKPAKYDDMHAKLVKKFPKRDPLALRRTMYGQVGYVLPNKRKVPVKGDSTNGFYLGAGAKK